MDDLIWKNVMFFVYLHLGSFWGLYLIFTGQCKIVTIAMGKQSKKYVFYELCKLLAFQQRLNVVYGAIIFGKRSIYSLIQMTFCRSRCHRKKTL